MKNFPCKKNPGETLLHNNSIWKCQQVTYQFDIIIEFIQSGLRSIFIYMNPVTCCTDWYTFLCKWTHQIHASNTIGMHNSRAQKSASGIVKILCKRMYTSAVRVQSNDTLITFQIRTRIITLQQVQPWDSKENEEPNYRNEMSLIFLNYGCHKNERQRGGVFAIFAGCLMCMMIFYKLSPNSTMVDTQNQHKSQEN